MVVNAVVAVVKGNDKHVGGQRLTRPAASQHPAQRPRLVSP